MKKTIKNANEGWMVLRLTNIIKDALFANKEIFKTTNVKDTGNLLIETMAGDRYEVVLHKLDD